MISQNEIFDFLNKQNTDLITYLDIANYFGVTKKTIVTYIDEIESNFSDNIRTTKSGVYIIQKFNSNIRLLPATIEERKSYILRSLLTKFDSLDIDELSSTLYISEVTLNNEIKKIRKFLIDYKLTLKMKSGNIFLLGEPKDKQKLLIDMIYEEAQNSIVSLKTLNEIFPQYNVENIRKILLNCLNDYHLFIDEYSMINLVLHILIAMDQSRTIHAYKKTENLDFDSLDSICFEVIQNACNQISLVNEVSFTQNNLFQFTILLMTRTKKKK